ncbi:hypothetical protein JYK14_15690 [Siccirubricoccus sp. KC 17139]|uniref:SPOR domain-containing protein n=1 Tax=Siccirubricoccus soli TaxID=2899147 RepID=A0ABT1D6P5_9PROT|nr:hypothetical protein [Siccirubricoccus soli]MCO6417592.1 hypothetical protein [Siccirubricoccus soli]MCP2683727.1 hypothetical protein [Siccirubricoccus soli]
MAIEVNSAGWTGQTDDTPATQQVCGEFHDSKQLDEALSRLEGSAFQRADLSVRVPGREDRRTESERETPVREDDARNLRTLGTSTAAAAVGMAAAGLVVGTGGAALPAVAAAAAAGGATLAAGEAAGQGAAPGGHAPQHHATDQHGSILMVHTASAEKAAKAEEVLRACGAARVWREGSA